MRSEAFGFLCFRGVCAENFLLIEMGSQTF